MKQVKLSHQASNMVTCYFDHYGLIVVHITATHNGITCSYSQAVTFNWIAMNVRQQHEIVIIEL